MLMQARKTRNRFNIAPRTNEQLAQAYSSKSKTVSARRFVESFERASLRAGGICGKPRRCLRHRLYGDLRKTCKLAEARVSRTHRRPLRTTAGFEDREDHRSLSASVLRLSHRPP